MQSGPEQSASNPEHVATTEPSGAYDFTIAPMIAKSQQAFRRDLPQLLDKRHGWWVAYHGDERIGFGRSQLELYDECIRRSLRDDEFVIRVVAPEAPAEIDTEQLQDV
jgi:hypothetical protein